jgi:hypothetical protein
MELPGAVTAGPVVLRTGARRGRRQDGRELRTRYGRHVAVFGPQLRVIEAWLAAAEGNVSAAIDLALEAAELALRSGQTGIEMTALHDAIRLGDRTSLQRLVDVCGQVDGRLAEIYSATAAALLDRDADGIYSAAQQFEEIGSLLSAADTAAQAAVLFKAKDDRRATTEAAAMADRLDTACGGIKTPALILAANPHPRTRNRQSGGRRAVQP